MTGILERIFLQVINLSLTGSYVILIVLCIRLCLNRGPKVFAYGLWSIVFLRLVLPFSLPSVVSSLKPFATAKGDLHYIPTVIGLAAQPQVNLGTNPLSGSLTQSVNQLLPAATPTASVNPMQLFIALGATV